MNMRLMKKKLAVLLTVLLILPVRPVIAANTDFMPQAGQEHADSDPVHTPGDAEEGWTGDRADRKDLENGDQEEAAQDKEDDEDIDESLEEELDNDLNDNGNKGNGDEAPDEELLEEASPSDALRREPQDEVIFNTGNAEFSVVSQEDFEEYELGDAYFEEDGSYTINIPEANPFFPYEVQFTCDGEVSDEWFMSPDDSVEIGGHTFYVSAYFDGTAVTQMSLEVAQDTVVVYPEKKEFTNDGGTAMFSLLPIKEKRLSVDLTHYTPVELTMVSVDSIFTGDDELQSGDKIIWTYGDGDKYVISSPDHKLDLSRNTWEGGGTWQMIVGDDDQLAGDNIRYLVDVKVTESGKWLIPTVYWQDEDGRRTAVEIDDSTCYYDDFSRRMEIEISGPARWWMPDEYVFFSLDVNPDVFPVTEYDTLGVFEIDDIFGVDMTQPDAGV